jgi:hypothetical protein
MGEVIPIDGKFDERNDARVEDLPGLLARINGDFAHFLKIGEMTVREKAALAEIVQTTLQETETRYESVDTAIMNHALATDTEWSQECNHRDRGWYTLYVQPAINRWIPAQNQTSRTKVLECVGHILRVLRFNLAYNQ